MPCIFFVDDPIFSGLAISSIFGIFVSTLLTLVGDTGALLCLYAHTGAQAAGLRGNMKKRPLAVFL
jgi:hypothetical protein